MSDAEHQSDTPYRFENGAVNGIPAYYFDTVYE